MRAQDLMDLEKERDKPRRGPRDDDRGFPRGGRSLGYNDFSIHYDHRNQILIYVNTSLKAQLVTFFNKKSTADLDNLTKLIREREDKIYDEYGRRFLADDEKLALKVEEAVLKEIRSIIVEVLRAKEELEYEVKVLALTKTSIEDVFKLINFKKQQPKRKFWEWLTS